MLGRALSELGIQDQVTVVTKVRPLTENELSDRHNGEEAVRESIEHSRRRLDLEAMNNAQECLLTVF